MNIKEFKTKSIFLSSWNLMSPTSSGDGINIKLWLYKFIVSNSFAIINSNNVLISTITNKVHWLLWLITNHDCSTYHLYHKIYTSIAQPITSITQCIHWLLWLITYHDWSTYHKILYKIDTLIDQSIMSIIKCIHWLLWLITNHDWSMIMSIT